MSGDRSFGPISPTLLHKVPDGWTLSSKGYSAIIPPIGPRFPLLIQRRKKNTYAKILVLILKISGSSQSSLQSDYFLPYSWLRKLEIWSQQTNSTLSLFSPLPYISQKSLYPLLETVGGYSNFLRKTINLFDDIFHWTYIFP